MNKLLTVVGFAVVGLGINLPAQAATLNVAQAHLDSLPVAMSMLAPQDLINWKVGDTANYDVSVSSFGNIGTMAKAVEKDEGTSIWVKEDLNLSVQKQVVETQINKADGKVLKVLVDGKEQQIPNDQVQIISQNTEDVTVKAGTFKSVHIVAKTQQVSKIEIWANPQATVMEGTIKQLIDTGNFTIDMELSDFHHGQ